MSPIRYTAAVVYFVDNKPVAYSLLRDTSEYFGICDVPGKIKTVKTFKETCELFPSLLKQFTEDGVPLEDKE